MNSECPSMPNGVIGPTGKPLTVDNFPPARTKRWVTGRKAELIVAVRRHSNSIIKTGKLTVNLNTRSGVALEKEFARLRKASESAEARLKSVSDDFATRIRAIEKVVEKEFAPNVLARLRTIEKGLAAYKKASEKELTRLKKSYDRELTKLRKAKGGALTKISKSSNAEPATKKPASAKARRTTQAKTGARKAPSSRRRKSAVSTATKRAGPKMTISGKAGSATKTSTRKKPAAKL